MFEKLTNHQSTGAYIVLIKCSKIFVFGSTMLPIAFSTVGSGILFGLFSLASARNPDESEKLYGSTLVAFALMETFVFLGLVIGVLVNFVL